MEVNFTTYDCRKTRRNISVALCKLNLTKLKEMNLLESEGTKNYKCREEGCNDPCLHYTKLEIHRGKHTRERPFICDFENCDKTYTNLAHLRRHKCFVHEKSAEVSCTVEGCRQVYNNRYSLRKHINQQHSENGIVFKCAECLKGFRQKRQLKKHLRVHGEKDALECNLCNISFGSLHLYNKHKRIHKIHTCDCGTTFNKWTMFCEHRKKSCTIRKVDHKCVICNKVFTTQSNLKVHSLCHVEESQIDKYHCPYLNCKRNYKYKKNLNVHISAYHEGKNDDVKINCTEEGCNVVLKSKKNLKQHILKMHSGLPKKVKDRAPRKDKGKRKKCMASIMSGVPLPIRENIAIIKQSTKTDNATRNIEESLSTYTSVKAVHKMQVNSGEVVPSNRKKDPEFTQKSDNQMCSSEFLNVEGKLNQNQIRETLECV